MAEYLMLAARFNSEGSGGKCSYYIKRLIPAIIPYNPNDPVMFPCTYVPLIA